MTDQAILTLIWGICGIGVGAVVLVVGYSIYQTIRKDRQAQREHEARMGQAYGEYAKKVRGRRKA